MMPFPPYPHRQKRRVISAVACCLAGAAVALAAAPTKAQTYNNSNASDRQSWLPYTTAGYVGVAYGDAKHNLPCAAGQSCGDPDGAFKVYTGGMLSPYLGLELGYLQVGDADRNGGVAKAKGANVAFTGFLPLGADFSLMGKLGTTYSWTKTTAGTGVAAATGKEKGFGWAYGAGLSYDFGVNWSATLDWERHRMKFAGTNQRNVDVTSLGAKYRF